MADLPTGTVTYLLTDIEGSTALWERDRVSMSGAVARHDALIARLVTDNAGVLLKTRGEGDSAFAVFVRATDAVRAAFELQRALRAANDPDAPELRVRVALHSGESELRDGDYFGPAVNRAARIRAIAHGGQTLLSLAAS